MLENIKIIYEDEELLVIDKPAGLVIHSDERTKEATLNDWLELNYPQIKNIGRPHTLDNERYASRYGCLTRLDRATSGVILIAKTAKLFEYLSDKYEKRQVHKVYIAIVEGDILPSFVNLIKENKIQQINAGEENEYEKVYKIDRNIGRSKVDPRKWTSGEDMRNTSREAITNFKILEVMEYCDNKYSKLELSPLTGRTHQLRVHLSYLGFPIIGDARYGDESKTANLNINLKLQAKSVSFVGVDGNERSFVSNNNLEL